MNLYRITYLSDVYHVSAYVAFPFECGEAFTKAFQDWCSANGATASPVHEPANDQLHAITPGAKRWPGFLYCRGGIGRVGMVKLDWMQSFCRQGFIVMAPCYRGADGGEGRDEFGGADCEDVYTAIRLLKGMPWLNPDLISVMGFSRGSINATKAAIAFHGTRSLVLWGGVADLAATYEERVDLRRMLKRVVGGTPSRVPDAYRDRSPLQMVDRITCPTLVVHGAQDVQVDVRHADAMVQVMQSRSKDVTFHRLEGYDHHLPPMVHEATIERMFEWISQHH